MIILATIATIYLLMARYDSIATAYDEYRRKTNWDYCQCSGSFRGVMVWWWRR
jgi:hypothetical protein